MSTPGTAEVVRKYIEESFDPQTPVMVLRWPNGDRLWELPEGLCVAGPAPSHLGILIRRAGESTYAVRLLWDRTQLSWPALSKMELLGSCLPALMNGVGLDLWSMLEQPIAARIRVRAA